MTTVFNDKVTVQRVTEALRRIASVGDADGRVVINLPIMYPSGANVVVEIERNDDRFWVSDMGYGSLEAETSGAQSFFRKCADRLASEFSVQFDGDAIFALWVNNSRLESAIVCVANASARASAEAVRAASEARVKQDNERIFSKIVEVFGSRIVARTADIVGRHAHWEAHNVVVFPNRQTAVFEHMTPHTTSISTRFLMFSDIRAADQSVSLNAVVRDVESLGEKGQMIADLANIVPISASSEQISQFARRA